MFQVEEGGTREAKGAGWGVASLSGSPSVREMVHLSERRLRGGGGGGYGGGETEVLVESRVTQRGGDSSLFLVLVGAYTDELCLMV